MGLVSFTLGLPFAPVRGVIGLARLLEQRAAQELYDPSKVRRKLEETEEAAESGEISEEQAQEAQKEILAPMIEDQAPSGPPDADQEDTGQEDTGQEDADQEPETPHGWT